MPHATKNCEPIMHVAISAVPSTDARLCSDDCGLSLLVLSRSSSVSDAREHGKLVDFRKLDRYFSVIANRTFAV
jgi:hypothetical protein